MSGDLRDRSRPWDLAAREYLISYVGKCEAQSKPDP